MFIDAIDNAFASFRPARTRRMGLTRRLVRQIARFSAVPRKLQLDDLPERGLADLGLVRDDVRADDPREPRIF